MVHLSTKVVGLCCILGGSALTVDFSKPSGGCSPTDLTKFQDNGQKQGAQFAAVFPELQEAYKTFDIPKANNLMSKITPKYCGQMDIVDMSSETPTLKFSALQKCIRKSQGVSVGCASCFPAYLQKMLGKHGQMAPGSCMKKCSKVTPETGECLMKMQDPTAMQKCLTPHVKKNSAPCLECSKPHLIEYTNCLGMGFLNTEVHMNTLLSVIKSEGPMTILTKNITNEELTTEEEPANKPNASASASDTKPKSGKDTAEPAKEAHAEDKVAEPLAEPTKEANKEEEKDDRKGRRKHQRRHKH